MERRQKFSNKKIHYVLKEIYKNKKGSVSTVRLEDISFRLSKKYLLTVKELEEILSLLKRLNYIDFVAKTTQKGYTYTVKLKTKGEEFLRRKPNKLADFFIGFFVYVAFFLILVLLVFALRMLFIL